MSAPGRARLLLTTTAALLVGVVLFVHRLSPRALVSAHGLLHSAIALRIADGGVPPENPFFAGEPLFYYWVFHWLGAQLAGLTGLDPLHAFEALVVAAIVALVAAAGALGASLYRAPAAGALIAWLVFAGANAQAPLVLGARLLRNGTSVLADDPTYLWGLVHPVSGAMRIGDPYGMYGPLLPFFLNVTARPLALAALVVLLAALHRAWRRPAATTLFCVAAASFALGALGSLVALATTGALAAGLAFAAWRSQDGALARAAACCAALATGVLLAAPTYAHLFALAGDGGGLLAGDARHAMERLGTLAASAWLPLALAVFGTRRAPPDVRPFLGAVLVAAAILSLANVLLRLPSGNEDNFFHAALVLLALPAAGCALTTQAAGRQMPAGGRLGPMRTAAIALLFAPTAALVVATYLGRPPVPVSFSAGRLVRTPADSALASLYAWIAAQTPHDAVFVIDPGPPIRAFAGNTAELPAFTGRTIWTERDTHYLVKPHADAAARRRVARALTRGDAADPTDEVLVREIAERGRAIYVLPPDAEDPARDARLDARFGAPVFRAGVLGVWRWRPADPAPTPGTRP